MPSIVLYVRHEGRSHCRKKDKKSKKSGRFSVLSFLSFLRLIEYNSSNETEVVMDIVNRDSVKAFTTKDTSTIREILAPRNSCLVQQSLAEATLLPGALTQAHFHPRTEEIYYILSGSGLMAIEGETKRVAKGDGIAIPAGKRHQILNDGSDELVFLCCCVPAYTDDDTLFCDSLIPHPEDR